MTKTFFLFSCISLMMSCRAQHSDNNTPPAAKATAAAEKYSYNTDKPDRTRALPEALTEVSGNSWLDATHLVLIEDLRPLLYIIKLSDTGATVERTVSFE